MKVYLAKVLRGERLTEEEEIGRAHV